MQQDPLIAAADTEHGARLVVGEPLDIAQHDDLALTRRQIIERRFEDRQPSDGVETVLAFLRPAFEGISPLALGVEADRVDGVKRLDWRVRMLPGAGRALLG